MWIIDRPCLWEEHHLLALPQSVTTDKTECINTTKDQVSKFPSCIPYFQTLSFYSGWLYLYIFINRWCSDPDIRDAEETHCGDGWSGQYVFTFRTNLHVQTWAVGTQGISHSELVMHIFCPLLKFKWFQVEVLQAMEKKVKLDEEYIQVCLQSLRNALRCWLGWLRFTLFIWRMVRYIHGNQLVWLIEMQHDLAKRKMCEMKKTSSCFWPRVSMSVSSLRSFLLFVSP